MPTNEVKEPSLAYSLSCECELVRRGGLATALAAVRDLTTKPVTILLRDGLGDLGGIDLSPAAVEPAASLRSAAGSTACSI